MAASTTLPAVPDGRPFQCFHRPAGVGAGVRVLVADRRPGRPGGAEPVAPGAGRGVPLGLLRQDLRPGLCHPDARAWAHGGSRPAFPVRVDAGPLQSLFNSIAEPGGRLAVHARSARHRRRADPRCRPAHSGCVSRIAADDVVAAWPLFADHVGKPTGSTNCYSTDHIISALAIIVVGAYAAAGRRTYWPLVVPPAPSSTIAPAALIIVSSTLINLAVVVAVLLVAALMAVKIVGSTSKEG